MVNINLTNYILERVYSKTETDNHIKDYIGNIDLFEVVTELPSEDIEEKIYLVPYTSSEEHNIYDAYIYKDNEWKQIDRFNIDGVDLSEINTLINNKSDINHTHTVEDITDFPSIPTDISDLTDEDSKLYLDKLHDMNEHSLDEIIDNALIPYYTKTQSDSKYLTSHQDISMKADKVVATSISNGLMSSSDKKKLDSIESGTGEIDDTVTRNSQNPVKSSGIWSALVEKQEDIAQLDNIVDKYGNYIFNDDGFLFYGMMDQIYYDYGNTGELHFINSNGDDNCFDDISLNGHTHIISDVANLQTSLNNKQETLVSGTNIKTVNNESLLGNGNIDIQGGGSVDIATSWGNPTSDSKAPSEKLTKDTLDGKAPNVHTHDDYDVEVTDMEIQGDWGISSQGEFNTNVYGVIANLDSALSSTVRTTDIANNLTTTTSGKVLDARQGKALADSKADSVHTHSGYASSTHSHGNLEYDGEINSNFISDSNVSTVLVTDMNHGKINQVLKLPYSKISGTPTIPTKTSDLTNDGADGSDTYVERVDLSNVATSGEYSDLNNIPSSFPPSTHSHNWDSVTGKPSTFSPSTHNHDDRYYTESEVDTALSNKQATLVSGTNIKTINGSSLLGSGNISTSSYNVFYGECSTSSSEAEKEVTISYMGVNWSFSKGNILFVKFIYSNTSSGTLKIKINGVTKDIVTLGTLLTTKYCWVAGEVVGFVYDGTNMLMLEQGTATTTYFGITKLSSSTSSTREDMSATPKAVKTAYDLADSKADFVHTHTVSNITDMGTVELLVNYTDGTSETLTLYKQNSS